MLGLSATYNYYLFNGNVDMRKDDSETKSYQISWADMVYLTESLVINEMRLSEAV